MKWTIEIDCTPEEARRFMGMPDVQELHKEMMQKMQESFANMDAESLMKYWMPFMQTQDGSIGANSMGQGLELWQNMMNTMMSAYQPDESPKKKDSSTKKPS